jgi:post-segregation antitoxin (ccd killing protein)
MRRYAYRLPTAHSSEGDPSCVYYVCMARVNVYLPDDLAARAKQADLNVSSLTQRAIEEALSGQATDRWLAELAKLPPSGVTHEQVIEALDAVRDEYGW